MNQTITVTEAARHFLEFLNRVAYGGERFTLVRGNRPVAELGPVPRRVLLKELPDIMGSLPKLGEEDADTFAQDILSARQGIDATPVVDPWAS